MAMPIIQMTQVGFPFQRLSISTGKLWGAARSRTRTDFISSHGAAVCIRIGLTEKGVYGLGEVA